MVTGLEWDDWGVEPWVDKGEVVGAHLVDTLGVLINERGVGDRVGTGLEVNYAEQSVGHRDAIGWAERKVLIGGVVGPFGGNRGVAASPEESLDRVGETNVDRARRVRVEVLDWGGLHLLDEDVAWGASHLLTFIVGHDGVVGPHVDVRHDLVGVWVEEIARHNWARFPSVVNGVIHIDREQISKVAESKVDAHFVVWESGRWESDTGVARVEEGEGEVEGGSWENLATKGINVHNARTLLDLGWGWEGNSAWVGKSIDVTNHVVVTVALAGWDGESRPEIEVVVVKASGNEIVERDGAFRDQVVHQIARPAQHVVASDADAAFFHSVGSGRRDGVHRETQPRVQEVITSTRDRH